MKTKHTPGPWSQDKQAIESKNFVIAMACRNRVHGMTKDECYANARLIAAAPELLAALQGALEHWAIPSSICKDRAAYEAAIAAIAKATGESK